MGDRCRGFSQEPQDTAAGQSLARFAQKPNPYQINANCPQLTVEYIWIADLNNSNSIDFLDDALFANEWAANDWCNRADMAPVGSPDGTVDMADLAEFVSHWLE
jgi:hypothetical protein